MDSDDVDADIDHGSLTVQELCSKQLSDASLRGCWRFTKMDKGNYYIKNSLLFRIEHLRGQTIEALAVPTARRKHVLDIVHGNRGWRFWFPSYTRSDKVIWFNLWYYHTWLQGICKGLWYLSANVQSNMLRSYTDHIYPQINSFFLTQKILPFTCKSFRPSSLRPDNLNEDDSCDCSVKSQEHSLNHFLSHQQRFLKSLLNFAACTVVTPHSNECCFYKIYVIDA